MKINKKIFVGMLMALAFCFIGCNKDSNARWEYTTLNTGGNVNLQELNRLGAEGWEFVQLEMNRGSLIFKRRLP